MALNQKGWDGGFKRVKGTETAKKTLAIATDESLQVHILNYEDLAGTDLGLSAATYPTLYIHGTASVSEYAKMYDDSTDFHIQAVGANVLLNAPTNGDITLQINSTDEFVFNASTANLGSNTITNAGDIIQVVNTKMYGTPVAINSVGAMLIQQSGISILGIDDAAVSLTSAGLGTTVYIKAQTGAQGAATAGSAGASIYISAGEGGSTTGATGTGGAGGDIWLVAGTSGAGSTGVLGGKGGDIKLLPGMFGGTAVSPGYVQIRGTASWVAGSLGTVSSITLRGPVGSISVHEWLKILDLDGTVVYIPAFIEGTAG